KQPITIVFHSSKHCKLGKIVWCKLVFVTNLSKCQIVETTDEIV
ncbi:unnamed protein product, partial [Tenebrio molitor]